ncbi:hypothetical protein NT2_13_00040 [Caenibius tardaugens NBRC 16725]|uniref:SnoaL-like domain-containing protein n=1 Tax=Caenibius tardaugens NBRC 16725 TaxID=1219035 RepID=U3A836_9SPHN|nr:nuclear transport factor 2 family protein [Caenibius tardaugens]AZI37946.1 nuclear transport factor 2 family protein [Caenibius tardaugens NBRC 16725]GAD50918.1 hypothetical protein NT2_13_00040 [Caenibius tardaugens NBRC 16725]
MGAQVEEGVRDILDQWAIEAVLKRYARALDERAFDALDLCFTADAHLDYTCAGGPAGPYPDVKRWLEAVLPPIAEMQHFTTNVEITVDGNEARGTSYTLNINGLKVASGEVKHMIVGAQYIDQFRRTPDGWRIVDRREERFATFGHRFGPEDVTT